VSHDYHSTETAWPVCTTHPPCQHAIRHPSPDAASTFATRSRAAKWTDGLGHATCACHDNGGGFPCDEAVDAEPPLRELGWLK
jgi:hypothetical protein